MTIAIAFHHRSKTGESPVWCDRTGSLWWCDIHGMSVQRLQMSTGDFRIWTLTEPVGCLALTDSGNLVLGLKSGFAHFDPAQETLTPLARPEPNRLENRLNDGAVSRSGKFFAISVASPASEPFAALHRLDGRKSALLADGFHVGNGLAFSPDDRHLYVSDSWAENASIWRFDHDPHTGKISNRSMFYDLRGGTGRPDGGCVDEDGYYWSAAIGAGALLRIAPDGRLDRTYELPVSHPTKMSFGGPDLDQLFVTTLVHENAGPDDGKVFRLKTGFRGLPEPRIAEADLGLDAS